MTNIIDMHTHVYDEDSLRDYKEKSKGQVSRIITYPYIADTGELKGLDAALEMASKHEEVSALGTIDMNSSMMPQLERMRRLFESKHIVGIKLYPGYQFFYPHDDKVDPVAELCGEFNKPLVFHCGITHSNVKGTVLKYSQPEHIDEIAVRHPYTNMVICHFGFPDYMDTATVLSDNDNVYADLSGTVYGATPEDLEEMMSQNVSDLKRAFSYFNNDPDIRTKIMFATDYIGGFGGLSQVQPYIDFVKRLFEPQYHDSVFHGVAEKLFFSSGSDTLAT